MDYSEIDKAIFKLPDEDIKQEKSKRKLTEKQMENLAKGRQKMAEKRALKLSKEAAKMSIEDKKTNLAMKKEAVKQQERVEKVKTKEQQAQQKQMDEKKSKVDLMKKKVSEIKHKYLDKAETPYQYKTFKKVFESMPETHYEDETKIKEYLISHYNSIETAKKNKSK